MRAFVVFIFLFAFITEATAGADNFAGGWKGTWTRDGDALPVTATFTSTNDAWSGWFDSDALQVAGIPFGSVSDTNGKVHFQIEGDRNTTVFDGSITGDEMSGTFQEGNDRGVFHFVRATLPSASIRTRDVTFQDKDVTLAGTLLFPRASGRYPAVVFLHGSGPEGRWANRYLARKFAGRGIVALIYDKRGVGQSTGDWRKAGFDALAGDAVAGIRFLQSQSEVDATRVGVYGHSQGGTIAPLVGVRAGDLRFIVASAAASADLAGVEEYSIGNSIGMTKLPPAERADAQTWVRAIVNVAYRGGNRAPLDALAAKFADRAWFFPPPPPDNYYWLFSKQLAAFRPVEYWRRIKAPVLLVYGAHDERVPPRGSARAIRLALRSGGNRSVTLKTYAAADHTFTIVDPPAKGGWPKHEPDYADMLVNWTLAQQ